MRDMPHARLSADMSDDDFWSTVSEIEKQREAEERPARRSASNERLMIVLAMIFLLGQLLAAALRYYG
ncbi:MAG: hypothetical protein AAF593_00655 [Planctomycetota bacterium]